MIPKFIWLTFHIHCLDVTHLSPSLQWTYLRGKKMSIYFRLRFMLPCQIIEWECQQPHMTKKILLNSILARLFYFSRKLENCNSSYVSIAQQLEMDFFLLLHDIIVDLIGVETISSGIHNSLSVKLSVRFL